MLFATNDAGDRVSVVDCRASDDGSLSVRECPIVTHRNEKTQRVVHYRVQLVWGDTFVTFNLRGRCRQHPHLALVARLLGPQGTAKALRAELGYLPGPLPAPPPATGKARKPADPRQLSFADTASPDGGDTG